MVAIMGAGNDVRDRFTAREALCCMERRHGAARPSVVRIRHEGLRGPDVASVLKRVWDEVGDDIGSGASVTVTERTIRLRRLPILGDRNPPES